MHFSPKDKIKAFDRLWDEALIGLTFISADGKFLKANPALCNMLEYTETELLEMGFQDLTVPSDIEADEKESEKVKEGISKSYIMNKQYITKTNRIIGITLKVIPIKEDDQFMYFLSQIGPSTRLIAYESEIEVMAENTNQRISLMSFLKNNKKWVLPILLPALGIALKLIFEIYFYLRTTGMLDGL